MHFGDGRLRNAECKNTKQLGDPIHATIILGPQKAWVSDILLLVNSNQIILYIMCVNHNNQFTVIFVSF